MHGLQNLFRQHALDKQNSADSWHSAYSNGRSISAHDSNSDLKSGSPWSQGMLKFTVNDSECLKNISEKIKR